MIESTTRLKEIINKRVNEVKLQISNGFNDMSKDEIIDHFNSLNIYIKSQIDDYYKGHLKDIEE